MVVYPKGHETRHHMTINFLRVKNFRCFSDEKWYLNSHFNVLIGNNGTGKTSILDAISIGIGTFFLGIDSVFGKTIQDKDVRKNTYAESREHQLPCEIELTGVVGENAESLTWQRSVIASKRNTRKEKDAERLIEIASSLQRSVRNDEKVGLPVFSYYGTGRLWADKKRTIKTLPLSSKFDVYRNVIDPIHNSDRFLAWMKKRAFIELQTQNEDEALSLVKSVVSTFLENNEQITFDVKLDSLVLNTLTAQGESVIEWTQLSDGYRNTIALAADIAYQCYALNSHWGVHATEKSKGVILIDEIDLHLHPSWQRKIVDSFKKAFPNLQFIVTTHSPFIIQSLNNDELIDLQGKDVETDYYKHGIEEIVEKEMHVENPIRSPKYMKMLKAAEHYYAILEEYKSGAIPEDIRRELDEVEIEFSNESAYVALLKSERKAKLK